MARPAAAGRALELASEFAVGGSGAELVAGAIGGAQPSTSYPAEGGASSDGTQAQTVVASASDVPVSNVPASDVPASDVPDDDASPDEFEAGDGAATGVTASEVLFELSLLAAAEERRWAALGLRALAGFAASRHGEPDPAGVEGRSGRLPDEYLADEVGCEFRLSPGEARNWLGDAVELCARLPGTVDALETAELDLARAHAVLAVTDSMSDEQAGEVERRVLRRGARSSRSGFRQAVRRVADQVDPDAPAERARVRLEKAELRKWRAGDGLAALGSPLPAEKVEAIWQRVTGLACQARVPGDSRTLGQVRADVYAALLLGENTSGLAMDEGPSVPVEVLVTVSATTLAGLDDEPGELAGHGSIPAELARKLAEYGHWRRILFDPIEGTLLDVGNRRHPTDALRRFVRTRDRSCRFPGCPLLAKTCDTDHTIQHSEHGRTKDGNLGTLCRRHHRMKDENSGWDLGQPSSGHFTWTSPVGRSYDVHPDQPWSDDPATRARRAPGSPGASGDHSESGGRGDNAPGGNASGGNAPGGNAPGGNAPGGNAPGGNAPGDNGGGRDGRGPDPSGCADQVVPPGDPPF